MMPFSTAGMYSLRHRAADDACSRTRCPRCAAVGSNSDLHLGILARAAGLLLVGVDLGVRLADGLAIGHLRRADVGIHAILATQPVDDDLEMQLAHAGQDGLPGLLVRLQAQARGLRQRASAAPSVIFSTPSLVFGSTEMSMTGTGKAMRSRITGSSDDASVSPVPVSFRPDEGRDVAGRALP